MRKRCHRKIVVPMPPRGLRPKLARSQLTDLGLAHIANLDALAKGRADEAVLWQWVGGTLTWSRVAELLQFGQHEMTEQLTLVSTVVERYGRTGRAIFTGPEYQLAKDGVAYMDELAARVDRPTAIAAAAWAEDRCNAIEAEQRALKVAA